MLYGIYVPTARTPVAGLDLERFPSREQAERELRRRTLTGASTTWYVRDRSERSHRRTRRTQVWDAADDTNYMRVFLRYASDPVPSLLDVPDEEWIVEPGRNRPQVIRLPWEEVPGETITLRTNGVRIRPSAASPQNPPERPARAARTTTPAPVPQALPAARGVCAACYQERTAAGTCGCAGNAGDVPVTLHRPSRTGWEQCDACGRAATAYARCGCS